MRISCRSFSVRRSRVGITLIHTLEHNSNTGKKPEGEVEEEEEPDNEEDEEDEVEEEEDQHTNSMILERLEKLESSLHESIKNMERREAQRQKTMLTILNKMMTQKLPKFVRDAVEDTVEDRVLPALNDAIKVCVVLDISFTHNETLNSKHRRAPPISKHRLRRHLRTPYFPVSNVRLRR